MKKYFYILLLGIFITLFGLNNVYAEESYVYWDIDSSLYRYIWDKNSIDISAGLNEVETIKFGVKCEDCDKTTQYVYDVSKNKDNSVIIRLVRNSNNKSTIYIEYDGILKFNDNQSNLFSLLYSLKRIEFNNIDTSNVTNMYGMFYNCYLLDNLDLSLFNTANVTNMGSMFQNCNKLTNINLSSFDTSNVQKMTQMFDHCGSLNELTIRNFDTSNCIDMTWMFSYCSNLKKIEFTDFNTDNIDDIISLFYHSDNLTDLYLNDFIISNNNILVKDKNYLKSMTFTNGIIVFENDSLMVYYNGTYGNISRSFNVYYLKDDTSSDNKLIIDKNMSIDDLELSLNNRINFDNLSYKLISLNDNNNYVSSGDKLRVYYNNELVFEYEITVDIPINSIDIGDDLELNWGALRKINALISPIDTTYSKLLHWASSNNSIVNVDSTGTIKAVGLGTAEISVCTKNDICDSINVTVSRVNANSLSYSGIGNKVYTGKQIKPGITIKYNGMTLKNGTDYTLSYGANKNTGKGSIKITLKGNYTGTKTIYFKIIPKKVSISSVKSNSKKTATIKYKKTTGASGYQIAYRLKGSKTWKYTTSTKLSKKITKLKRYKKYNFKVRAYKTIDGIKYYGAYSSTKTIKVK